MQAVGDLRIDDSASASPAVACRLAGAGKRFGGIWACRGVDLDILAGEVHAVMGENGAGKSTLMKMLHGVHLPDEGQVEVAGRPVSLASPRAAEDAGIAMVPQELDLFPRLVRRRKPVRRPDPAPHTPRHLRLEPHAPARPRPPSSASGRPSTSTRPSARFRARTRRWSRIRARPDARRPDPDPGRAHGRSDRDGSAAAVRHRPRADPARRGDRLHLPPPGRDLRDRRPDHGDARRRARPHGTDPGHRRRPPDPAHGGPVRSASCSTGRGIRPARSCSASRGSAGAACSATSPSRSAAARSSACRASSARGGRRSPRRSTASRPPTRAASSSPAGRRRSPTPGPPSPAASSTCRRSAARRA